jgi:hypothetical protein
VRAHFPALVLTLGEPHPGGLADTVRARLGAAFGPGAVDACDLGDLRAAGVLEGPEERVDPHALARWARAALAALVVRHSGVHPAPDPALTVLVLAEGDAPAARARCARAVEPLRRALDAVSLPPAMQRRLAVLTAWPCPPPAPAESLARLAAWVRDLERAATEGYLDAVFAVGRSNYRAQGQGAVHYLSRERRDELIAEQAELLLSTAVLAEVAALRRGVPRSPWTALGAAPLEGAGPPRAAAWPWLHWSSGWGTWTPATAHWSVGAEPAPDTGEDAPAPIGGAVGVPLRIRCFVGIPADRLEGMDVWEEAYWRYPFDERRKMHIYQTGIPRERMPETPAPAAPPPERVP